MLGDKSWRREKLISLGYIVDSAKLTLESVVKSLNSPKALGIGSLCISYLIPQTVIADEIIAPKLRDERLQRIEIEKGDILWNIVKECCNVNNEQIIGKAVNYIVDRQKSYSNNPEFLKRINLDTVYYDKEKKEFIRKQNIDHIRGDELRVGDILRFSNNDLLALEKFGLDISKLRRLPAGKDGLKYLFVTDELVEWFQKISDQVNENTGDINRLFRVTNTNTYNTSRIRHELDDLLSKQQNENKPLSLGAGVQYDDQSKTSIPYGAIDLIINGGNGGVSIGVRAGYRNLPEKFGEQVFYSMFGQTTVDSTKNQTVKFFAINANVRILPETWFGIEIGKEDINRSIKRQIEEFIRDDNGNIVKTRVHFKNDKSKKEYGLLGLNAKQQAGKDFYLNIGAGVLKHNAEKEKYFVHGNVSYRF
jgi:hypothetical protein